MFLLFQLTKIFTLHDKPIGSAPMGPEVTVFLCLLVPGLWFSSRCCCWWPDRSGSLPVSLPPTCLLDHLSTPPHPTKHTGLFALFFLSLLFQTIVLVLVFFFLCLFFFSCLANRQTRLLLSLFVLSCFFLVCSKRESRKRKKPTNIQTKPKQGKGTALPASSSCLFIHQPANHTAQHSNLNTQEQASSIALTRSHLLLSLFVLLHAQTDAA